MKYFLLFSQLLITTNPFAQTFEWAKTGPTSYGNKIVFSEKNYIYVSGNDFIAKFDSAGNLKWLKNISFNLFATGIRNIAVDENLNLYVLANFAGSIIIDSITISAPENHANTLLVKFDSTGSMQWVKRSYSNMTAYPDELTVDKNGNPIIIGRFLDSLFLDSFFLDAPETNQIFLAKYSSEGDCLWAKHIRSATFNGGSAGPKVKSDNLGNSYITGHYYGDSAEFDDITTIPHHYGNYPGNGIFFAKINEFGNFLWAKTIGGYGQEISGPMAVDDFGNTYLSSYSDNTVYFDNDSLTSTVPYYFTAKFDANGNYQWARYGGNVPMCAANSALYLSWPNILYKYDGNADLQWTKDLSGINISAMAAEKNYLYLTGSFNGNVNFDSITLSDSVPRMFIAKLKNPILPIEPTFVKDSFLLLPLETNEELDKNYDLKIFPCPAIEKINISFSSKNPGRDIKMKLFNVQGQSVYTCQIQRPQQKETKETSVILDVATIPKGVYFIEAIHGEERLVKKLILQ